jgi:hypothetical protein
VNFNNPSIPYPTQTECERAAMRQADRDGAKEPKAVPVTGTSENGLVSVIQDGDGVYDYYTVHMTDAGYIYDPSP